MNYFNDNKGSVPIFQSKKSLVYQALKDMMDGKMTFAETQLFIQSFEFYAVDLIDSELNKMLKQD